VPQGDAGYAPLANCSSLGGPNRPPANSTNNQRLAHAAARSLHTGGAMAAMGDGGIRFVNNSIPLATWRAMGTMALQDATATE
jgi:hypothetical protein